MIFDGRTGKILMSQEKLIKLVKEYFSSHSDAWFRKRLNIEKRRIKRLIKGE